MNFTYNRRTLVCDVFADLGTYCGGQILTDFRFGNNDYKNDKLIEAFIKDLDSHLYVLAAPIVSSNCDCDCCQCRDCREERNGEPCCDDAESPSPSPTSQVISWLAEHNNFEDNGRVLRVTYVPLHVNPNTDRKCHIVMFFWERKK